MAKKEKIDGLGDNMAGLISTLIGQFMPLSASEREQNAFNQRMAEDAFNRQIQYYENYQSPQAMVKQYQEAGINPALVAGYSPSNPPSSSAASGSGGSPALGLIQLAMEMRIRNKELDIQRDLADAEIENKGADTENKREDTQNKKFENMSAEEYYQLRNSSLIGSIHLMEQQTEESSAKTALNMMQSALLRVDFKTRERLNNLRVDILELQKEYQEYSNQEAKFHVEKQAERYLAELMNIFAQTKLANAHASQIRQYCEIMMKSPGLDADGKEQLSRLAQMTDAEIESMRKDNKSKWVSNYVGPLVGAFGVGVASAVGLLKILSPAKILALPTATIGEFGDQYGTFQTGNVWEN